jgi:hypothetical protein
MRLHSPEDRLRVLLLTNEEEEDGHHPGQRDGFGLLQRTGSIEAFSSVAPKLIAKSKDADGTLRELLDVIHARRPNVVVQISPQGIPYTDEWFQAVQNADPRPILLHWEGDAWGRWTKPVHPEMRLWWKAADVVFTVAVGKQRDLIERLGGRDVRFIPFTYDHIRYRTEEGNEPDRRGDYSEVVVIGNFWGNRYFVSRLPGARQRLRLVRGLQKRGDIPLSVYGRNWTGRGVRGPIPIDTQAAVARRALLTANWDHFPSHAAFYSDRLAVALLAGRAHVTTLHPSSEWLPGHDKGLFLEPTVGDAIRRVRELLSRPREEVLELGLAGHRWVRHRLSDREMALYILGAVDERLLHELPEDPWSRLPS